MSLSGRKYSGQDRAAKPKLTPDIVTAIHSKPKEQKKILTIFLTWFFFQTTCNKWGTQHGRRPLVNPLRRIAPYLTLTKTKCWTQTWIKDCPTVISIFRNGRIGRQFIKVERTENWKLHLQSLICYHKLSYFAASGHKKYLKSAN